MREGRTDPLPLVAAGEWGESRLPPRKRLGNQLASVVAALLAMAFACVPASLHANETVMAAGASGTTATRAKGDSATPPAAASDIPRLPSATGNPINDFIFIGTGELGQWLGLPADSALRLGGVAVGNGTRQFSGGVAPNTTDWAGFVAVSLSLDLDKAIGWKGAKIGVAGLQYNVQPVNSVAGSVQGMNSTAAVGPNNRTELYNYLFAQNLLDDQLQVVVGKLIPTITFGNVAKPNPTAQSGSYLVPSLTGLIYTPIFVVPTMLGRIPGYPDSAAGIQGTIAPNQLGGRFYLSAGLYDGRLGAFGTNTGLVSPDLSGPLFSIAELGGSWRAGAEQFPGQFALGAWNQGGPLHAGALSESSAYGIYAQMSQRLSNFRRGQDSSGINMFLQAGWSPSTTNLINASVGGGLTVWGPFAARARDSYGIGVSWAQLNDRPAAGYGFNASELMIQAYAQFPLIGNLFLEPVITTLPVVGFGKAPSISATLQLTAVF